MIDREKAIEQLIYAAKDWEESRKTIYKKENPLVEFFVTKLGGKKLVDKLKLACPQMFNSIISLSKKEEILVQAIDALNAVDDQDNAKMSETH